jgi:sphinganine-1-phosphate aldolase
VRVRVRVRARVLFGDACSFTHGVVDPIVELGALALARGIGLHVDNCLGGYLLSYMRRSGAFKRGVRAAAFQNG